MQWSDVMSWLPRRQPLKPRSASRNLIDGFMTQLGPLIDISATGMRLRLPKDQPLAPQSVLNFQVRNGGSMFSLRGIVVWCRAKRKSEYAECGVRFIDLSPEHRALVEHVARFGLMPRRDEKVDSSARGASKQHEQHEQRNSARPTQVSVEVENLYAILRVPSNATPEQIRTAYRTLARQFHPDRCPTPEATQQFTLVSKAFSVLRDPELRARYDEMLRRTAA